MPDFLRAPEPSWNVEPVMSEVFAGLDEIAAALPSGRWMLVGGLPVVTPGTTIRLSDVASALSPKGAALGTPSANRVRHAQDAVTLFACAQPDRLVLSKSMRTNINRAINALFDLQAWTYADPRVRRRAVRTVLVIRSDWTVPAFVLARRFGREQ